MPRRGDGLVLRGKTWWLDFSHQGQRHQARLDQQDRGAGIGSSGALESPETGCWDRGKKRKDILFEKAAEEFLKWAHANKRLGTVDFCRYCLQSLGRSFNGKKLGEIHPFLIEKHKQLRIAAGHRVAINRELAALSVLFNRCREWKKYEGENPLRSVKKIDEPLTRLRFLSDDEETALLGRCDEPLTGLRITAEALTLKIENIDLKRKQLTIEAAYSKNRDTQTIPLHSKLVAPLQDRIRESRSGLVFETREGKPVRSVRTAFTNACERANLSGVTPHTLRHTFASRLGMAGINNLTLQKLGRWKEPKMILRYAHLSPEYLEEAIEKNWLSFPYRVTTAKASSS